MIVVSDTSPLNYLILIGEVEVLPRLFVEVHTPPEVLAELLHPLTPPPVQQWANAPPPWLKISKATTTLSLPRKFGPGETQAMALAKELGAAVLMDERDGTKEAVKQGLTVFGTMNVLDLAAAQKLLDLPNALSSLQRTSFRVSQSLINAALAKDALRRTSP